MKQKISKGQSLVEVLASLGMVILIVAALVNLVTASLRSSNYAKTAAQANKFAQEAIEWVRSLRDRADDWDSFKSSVLGIRCLKNITDWPTNSVACGENDFVGTTIFKREAVISEDEDSPSRLNVKITVKWKDQATEVHISQVETVFTDTSKWK